MSNLKPGLFRSYRQLAVVLIAAILCWVVVIAVAALAIRMVSE